MLCSGCQSSVPRAGFSKTQAGKPAGKRLCKSCSAGATAAHQAAQQGAAKLKATLAAAMKEVGQEFGAEMANDLRGQMQDKSAAEQLAYLKSIGIALGPQSEEPERALAPELVASAAPQPCFEPEPQLRREDATLPADPRAEDGGGMNGTTEGTGEREHEGDEIETEEDDTEDCEEEDEAVTEKPGAKDLHCSGCQSSVPRAGFSKTQAGKPAGKRLCKSCSAGAAAAQQGAAKLKATLAAAMKEAEQEFGADMVEDLREQMQDKSAAEQLAYLHTVLPQRHPLEEPEPEPEPEPNLVPVVSVEPQPEFEPEPQLRREEASLPAEEDAEDGGGMYNATGVAGEREQEQEQGNDEIERVKRSAGAVTEKPGAKGLRCSGCQSSVPRAGFSKTQAGKPASKRRCKSCSAGAAATQQAAQQVATKVDLTTAMQVAREDSIAQAEDGMVVEWDGGMKDAAEETGGQEWKQDDDDEDMKHNAEDETEEEDIAEESEDEAETFENMCNLLRRGDWDGLVGLMDVLEFEQGPPRRPLSELENLEVNADGNVEWSLGVDDRQMMEFFCSDPVDEERSLVKALTRTYRYQRRLRTRLIEKLKQTGIQRCIPSPDASALMCSVAFNVEVQLVWLLQNMASTAASGWQLLKDIILWRAGNPEISLFDPSSHQELAAFRADACLAAYKQVAIALDSKSMAFKDALHDLMDDNILNRVAVLLDDEHTARLEVSRVEYVLEFSKFSKHGWCQSEIDAILQNPGLAVQDKARLLRIRAVILERQLEASDAMQSCRMCIDAGRAADPAKKVGVEIAEQAHELHERIRTTMLVHQARQGLVGLADALEITQIVDDVKRKKQLVEKLEGLDSQMEAASEEEGVERHSKLEVEHAALWDEYHTLPAELIDSINGLETEPAGMFGEKLIRHGNFLYMQTGATGGELILDATGKAMRPRNLPPLIQERVVALIQEGDILERTADCSAKMLRLYAHMENVERLQDKLKGSSDHEVLNVVEGLASCLAAAMVDSVSAMLCAATKMRGEGEPDRRIMNSRGHISAMLDFGMLFAPLEPVGEEDSEQAKIAASAGFTLARLHLECAMFGKDDGRLTSARRDIDACLATCPRNAQQSSRLLMRAHQLRLEIARVDALDGSDTMRCVVEMNLHTAAFVRERKEDANEASKLQTHMRQVMASVKLELSALDGMSLDERVGRASQRRLLLLGSGQPLEESELMWSFIQKFKRSHHKRVEPFVEKLPAVLQAEFCVLLGQRLIGNELDDSSDEQHLASWLCITALKANSECWPAHWLREKIFSRAMECDPHKARRNLELFQRLQPTVKNFHEFKHALCRCAYFVDLQRAKELSASGDLTDSFEAIDLCANLEEDAEKVGECVEWSWARLDVLRIGLEQCDDLMRNGRESDMRGRDASQTTGHVTILAERHWMACEALLKVLPQDERSQRAYVLRVRCETQLDHVILRSNELDELSFEHFTPLVNDVNQVTRCPRVLFFLLFLRL